VTLVQIDGLSGTGKTTLAMELRNRGFHAVDSDSAFAYFADPVTGLPTAHQIRDNWKWDGRRLRAFAEQVRGETAFVCGGALNSEDFSALFRLRFVLIVDDETLRRRILTRRDNDFGKDPNELAEQLALNACALQDASAIGAVPIDATRPVETVADDILRVTSAQSLT